MSTSNETGSKYIVYSFSGSRDKFNEWKTKTLSLARVHKVHQYLTKDLTIPTEAEAEAAAEGSETIKKYDANVKAYDLLIRSCTGTPLGLIESVENGNAHKAWNALLAEYETNEDDVQTMESNWNNCKLESTSMNPTEWFVNLDRLNRLLKSIGTKYEKDDVQIAGHILNNVCEQYKTVVTSIESGGTTKDVKAIKEALKKHWTKYYKPKEGNAKQFEAFIAEQRFKGKCNYCSKSGHKEKDCWKKQSNEKNGNASNGNRNSYNGSNPWKKKQMKCWICGGDHAKKQCPKYKGGKGSEVNHLYQEGMFLCEQVTDERTYKEVLLVGEVNMTSPVRDHFDKAEVQDTSDNDEDANEESLHEKDQVENVMSPAQMAFIAKVNNMSIKDVIEAFDLVPFEEDFDMIKSKGKVDTEKDEVAEKDHEAPPNQTDGGRKTSTNRRSIPRLSTCASCKEIGLYLEPCIKCGSTNETLDKKSDDVSEESKVLSYCHKCKEIGIFATRCKCGGYCLVPVKIDDENIGTSCKCRICDKVGKFGQTCKCGHVFTDKLEGKRPYQNEMYAVTTNDDNAIDKFLADTGATTHIVRTGEGLMNVLRGNLGGMKVGNGAITKVNEKGDLNVMDVDGNVFTLYETHVTPGITRDIISITQLLREGWRLGGDRNRLQVTLDGKCIKFIRDESNGLYFIDLKRVMPEINQGEANNINTSNDDDDCELKEKKVRFDFNNNSSNEKVKSMDINDAHRRWGHPGESRMKALAVKANVTLTGTFRQCDGCGMAKAKCKPIPKATQSGSSVVGERLFIDTSGPFPSSMGGNKYVRGAVDDASGLMVVEFGKTKDGMLSFVKRLIEQLKSIGKCCKFIRCDNAGEHNALKVLCQENGIKLEFTPSYSPQYNGRIERRFAVVMTRAMAMMYDAGLKETTRRELWGEAFNTAVFLGDIFPTARSDKCAFEMFFDEQCKLYPYLIEFGRIGMVTNKKKGKKLEPSGTSMVMVGYALNHKVGSYRMYNPVTKRVVICDNVTWSEPHQWRASDDMKEIFSQDDSTVTSKDETITDGTPIKVYDGTIEIDEKVDKSTTSASSSVRGRRMLKELATSYNDISDVRVTGDTSIQPVGILTRSQRNARTLESNILEDNGNVKEPFAVFETCNDGGERVEHYYHFCFNVALNSDPGEPKTFKEAMSRNDHKLWKEAVASEINNFLSRNAWKFVKRSEVKTKGRRPIPTKHVFKKKIELDPETGKEFIRYKDRIVSLGFMQIPGVDYTESFSPVVTDSGLRIVFGIVLYKHDSGWECHSYDVEAAFLQPSMEGTEMFIDLPAGLIELGFITQEEADLYCIQLMNSMYGNVDAALRWILLKTEYLTGPEIMMTQSRADPCIFFKRDSDGEPALILAMTVDDCAVAGKPETIEWLLKKIEKKFKITRGGKIRKHLGIDYDWKLDEQGKPYIEARMDRKRDDIINSFEEMEKKQYKVRKTPAAPGSVLKKHEGEAIRIEDYRSMIGKIMYYATKVGPKIVNAIRELATHMGCPGEEQWKALGHLVGYLKGTKETPALILKQPLELRCVSFVDASYGNSCEGRRSVSGQMHTLGGMLTAYSSRTQKTVSMSSAESEYIAASSAVQEVIFQQMLLGEVCETIYPGVIYEDNEGAIFLSKNKQVSQRTKHIDLRYHFLRDFTSKSNEGCERGRLMKVDGKENYADLMTKNTDGATFAHLGDDIDKGLDRFRNDIYRNDIIKQLGGMSRIFKYEVVDEVKPYRHWMKVVRVKGKLRYEREEDNK